MIKKIFNKKCFLKKIIAGMVTFIFVIGSVGTSYAQSITTLPVPGTMVALSEAFTPSLLKGVKVYADNPFRLDFILDKGNSHDVTEALELESIRLIKYFLASITVPEDDLWVNLSPYEKDRIVPDAFGVTEMGRDLLSQDYILKQITASVIYPEGEVGKAFWAKVYAEAQKQYGTTDIPIDTFNKVWIVPEKAVVYEGVDSAYVVESRLKVMLETDYLAESKNASQTRGHTPEGSVSPSRLPSNLGLNVKAIEQALREIVIPLLEKEVNEGKNFAQLRQVYHSLILAVWYKDKIKESLFGKAYVDQKKTGGVDIEDRAEKEKIWEQYVQSFQKGVFSYIKEKVDSLTGEAVPQKYIAGGLQLGKGLRQVYVVKPAMQIDPSEMPQLSKDVERDFVVNVDLNPVQDEEILNDQHRWEFQEWLNGVSLDKLENKINILNLLNNLIETLHDPSWHIRRASLDALKIFIKFDFMNQQEIKEMIQEKNILEKLIEDFKRGDIHINKINIDILQFLFLKEIVKEEDIRRIFKEKNILEILIASFYDGDFYMQRANFDVLKSLVRIFFINEKDVYNILQRKNILKMFSESLDGNYRYLKDVNVDFIQYLMEEGFLEKEEIKTVIQQKQILEGLMVGMTDQLGYARKVNVDILKVFIAMNLFDQEEIRTKTLDGRNVLEIILLSLVDLNNDFDLKKSLLEALEYLMKTGCFHQEDVQESMKKKNVLEILLLRFSRSEWDTKKSHIEIFKRLVVLGLVTKKDTQESLYQGKTFLEIMVPVLREKHVYVSMVVSDLFKNLVSGGLISKEDIFDKKYYGKDIVEILVDVFSNSHWEIKKAYADILQILVLFKLINKQDIKEKRYQGKSILEVVMYGLYNSLLNMHRELYIDFLKMLITKGYIEQQDTTQKIYYGKSMVEIFVQGLFQQDNNLRKNYLELLQSFLTAGFITKENLKEFIKKTKIQDPMLVDVVEGLKNVHGGIRRINADILNILNKTGLLTRQDVQEKRYQGSSILEIIISGIDDDDKDFREINLKMIRDFLIRRLVDQENKLTRSDVAVILKRFFNKDVVSFKFFLHYLKALLLFKDDASLAYQLSFWKDEELDKLFQVFNSFLKGTRADKDSGEEKKMQQSFLNFFMLEDAHTLPQAKMFFSYLKEKIVKMINDSSLKLAIRVYEVASIHAARGFIQATGIKPEKIIILYDKEIDLLQAERFFKGYEIESYITFNQPGVVKLDFHDDGDMIVALNEKTPLASLPYTPFKFNLSTKGVENIDEMKKSLGIEEHRKVIVLGSPSDTEFKEFMQTYNALYQDIPHPQRPLLIVAFRERSEESQLHLLGVLAGQSIAVRSEITAPLPDVRSNNVLILNTAGELFKMYSLADVAIIGNDRNIFEPASQQVASLHFEGSWYNNQEAKEILLKIGATKPFSKENLEQLMNDSRQTIQMAKEGKKAVEDYRNRVLAKAEEFILQVVGADENLRKKITTVSEENYGGIDLTHSKIDLKIKKEGVGEFKFNSQRMEELKHLFGLTPHIIDIQPMKINVLKFLRG